jgi:hypothetical protein
MMIVFIFVGGAESPIFLFAADLVLSNKLVFYDLENQVIGWTEYNCECRLIFLYFIVHFNYFFSNLLAVYPRHQASLFIVFSSVLYLIAFAVLYYMLSSK